MRGSEVVLGRLQEWAQTGAGVENFTSFYSDVLPLVREAESGIETESASMSVLFRTSPTVGAFVDVVDTVDREARRAVAGMLRGVPPHTLRGRGVRLVPRSDGLVVEQAQPGSLDVILLLGGLYNVVT